MKKNMGNTDRVVRILIAVVVLAMYFAGVLSGTIAAIMLIAAGIFIITGFISFCPLYLPFGISTRKTNAKQ